MAETLLLHGAQAILGGLIPLVTQPITQQISLARGFKKDLTKLQTRLENIQDLLRDAENRQLRDAENRQIATVTLKKLLKRLKSVACDLENVLGEFAYEALRRKLEVGNRKRDKIIGQTTLLFNGSSANLFHQDKQSVCIIYGTSGDDGRTAVVAEREIIPLKKKVWEMVVCLSLLILEVNKLNVHKLESTRSNGLRMMNFGRQYARFLEFTTSFSCFIYWASGDNGRTVVATPHEMTLLKKKVSYVEFTASLHVVTSINVLNIGLKPTNLRMPAVICKIKEKQYTPNCGLLIPSYSIWIKLNNFLLCYQIYSGTKQHRRMQLQGNPSRLLSRLGRKPRTRVESFVLFSIAFDLKPSAWRSYCAPIAFACRGSSYLNFAVLNLKF
ncbi:hypothetical protein Vadar_031826 [Vaccinium darrowii]|uniref:Uncharacterized protein n=1 Tax=Vaccinium darrowii TaxID=229202 RepID=A0ACB7XW40_9ERIC|nr:hypothetical protein Vadar_031826 [Vaccinium darrowii]